MRFAGGRAVEMSAETGADFVRAEMRDRRGRGPFLGEVSLVDGDSRVGKTGIVFLDTLFDENAACHIAFGQGIDVRRRGRGRATRSSWPAATTTPSSIRTS